MLNIEEAARTGGVDDNTLGALAKALEMGYGTDSATLTQGGALRVQSLDTTMQAVIATNDQFTLLNKLDKPRIGSTVDEWTEQSGVGGFLGGSTNTETGVIPTAEGIYNRRVGLVKYMTTRREVSLVASITNNIVDAKAVEQQAGAIQLLSDANYLCYTGNSAIVPTEFDGIEAQLRGAVAAGQVTSDHIIDLRGGPLKSIAPFTKAAAAVSSFNNFGTPTDLFWPNSVQADVDAGLDPAFRVALENNFASVQLGAPVSAIRLSQGVVKCNTDVFIPDDRMTMPFEVQNGALATANNGFRPQNLTFPAPASNASSMFNAPHAGNYYYAVAGITARGQSTAVVSAQAAVAAGQAVVLTITGSTGLQETGYAIYRSRRNGSAALADMRLVARIPRAGATTVFTDLNRMIPGTTRAFMLNMKKGATAIQFRQLLPMFKFDLYPTNSAVLPWAQLLFGFLRISKLRHHAMFDNILPDSADWRPFG